MGNNEEIKVDINALVTECKNMALNRIVANFAPDEKSRKTISDILAVFNKYGVGTETAIDILKETAEIMEKEGGK